MREETRQATVLVTGGAGFLGNAIAEAVDGAGHETHVTWRRTQPRHTYTAHQVSLDEPSSAARLIEQIAPDVVVNAIGGPHRPETTSQKYAAWRDSPVATSMLLEACRGSAIHLIHVGSSHEYAPSAAAHDEDSAFGPSSLRGVAAHAATSAVRVWADETGAAVAILRPFSVYGPGEPVDRVVPTLLRSAMSGLPFRTTPGPSSRDYVFVADVASAVTAVIDQRASGAFNLGSGVDTSVEELVTAAELAVGRAITVIEGEFEPRPWDRERWVSDPSRARTVLGWKADTSLIDGLRLSLP